MAESAQTYGTHRRFIPAYHFFALPVLFINIIVTAVRFARDPRLNTVWQVVVALALFTAILLLRFMSVRAQDRIIRLEERTLTTRYRS